MPDAQFQQLAWLHLQHVRAFLLGKQVACWHFFFILSTHIFLSGHPCLQNLSLGVWGPIKQVMSVWGITTCFWKKKDLLLFVFVNFLSVRLFVYFLRLSKAVMPGCFGAWTDFKLRFFLSLPSVRIVMITVVSHQTSIQEKVWTVSSLPSLRW